MRQLVAHADDAAIHASERPNIDDVSGEPNVSRPDDLLVPRRPSNATRRPLIPHRRLNCIAPTSLTTILRTSSANSIGTVSLSIIRICPVQADPVTAQIGLALMVKDQLKIQQ